MSNVQPGDIARVVAPYPICGRQRFVVVEQRAPTGQHEVGGIWYAPDPDAWIVRGRVRHEKYGVIGPLLCIGDICLRRVEPGEADDETLAWATVPGAVPAEVQP